MTRRTRGVALLAAMLALPACYATTTTTRTWGAPEPPPPPPSWSRTGHVELIRETVERREGNPVGGAAVGALVGGLLGNAIVGNGAGTLVGAAGGAVAGAAASQGSAERRSYEMVVRFDDGGVQSFIYEGYPPFRPGEAVVWTPQGLYRR